MRCHRRYDLSRVGRYKLDRKLGTEIAKLDELFGKGTIELGSFFSTDQEDPNRKGIFSDPDDEHVLRRSRMRDADTTKAARGAFDALRKTADKMDTEQRSRTVSYPIWGWPYPFLAACVSKSPELDRSLQASQSRLWIDK